MNGGEAPVEALRSAGVSHVFGRPGSSTMEGCDALAKDRPTVVHAKVDPDALIRFRRDAVKHCGGG